MRTYNVNGSTPKYGQPNSFTLWAGILTINADKTEYVLESDHGTACMGRDSFRLYAKHNSLCLTV